MAYPSIPPPGMALAAYPHPVQLPPGWGALIVSANRGPYLVPAPTTCKLKIDGREVSGMAEGTFHIAVPAGEHEVKYTDLFGIPMITTRVVVHPGTAQQVSFRFGGWRNRVHDGQGADITRFGMWSNYSILLITLAVVGACCGGLVLIPMLAGANGS
ncbi:hypothetical protein [Plantactinospora endophytica]|uniref:PEGA domain-containing protein n=1 Tax=Plantactinospora endophytica TaxID=673535 RepID=A0ABQ4E5D1_9ACTN|nr:hypothetical protein [Plantactinospora endophytica]GIG89909.1 hypothetical protein Pen02_48450 [Plantactinospora endophytica]